MRFQPRAQGAATDASKININSEQVLNQSPQPSHPNTSAQVLTRRAARRQADANDPTQNDPPPPAQIPRMSEREQISDSNGKAAKEAADNVAHRTRGRVSIKTADKATDLRALIDKAKKKSYAVNKPDKAEEVEMLYQQSLSDARLTALLEVSLQNKASPAENTELRKYVLEAKSKHRSKSASHPTEKKQTAQVTEIQCDEAHKAGSIRRSSVQPPKAMADTFFLRTVAATSAQRQTATPQVDEIPTLLATFCASTLWPRYCLLPPGTRSSPGFEALTTMKVNDRGERIPVHQAPEPWLEEAQTELSRLLEQGRADRKPLILKTMKTPGYKGQDAHALLAEEVVWAAHKGPFKGKQERKEIGLLLECYGVAKKGTY